ncbi:MAG TPA: tyrosine--tRNA ligase [Acholeplasmataceae bacterium]|jgi:tyrosyl-tRNA synthetase|nr:tyrosine--tRNA ligase [Acholeplasmataceae bacterium]
MNALLEELKWRGLIYDIVNEEELSKRLEKPITLYCGFDPTADSLHIGSLLPIVTLMRFKKAGHRVIALTGGGTGLIGDPSGKKNERSLNPLDTVKEWSKLFKKQMSKFLKFDDKTSFSVDNYKWLGEMKAIELWRDYGRHFNINYMLAKESVKSRLDTGLTYLEFSYMILQSIDFLKLYQDPKYRCEMQIGGQDQWGNITAGMELIRKVEGPEAEVYGLTVPLITKSDGTKFGKTESGAVWLDEEKTSPYEMYQFFINTADDDVIKLLKYFTFLSKEEIEDLEEKVKTEPHLREAQKVLAREIVLLVHGEKGLENALKLTDALFSGNIKELDVSEIKMCFKDVPSIEEVDPINIIDAVVKVGAAQSKRQAREFITNGAININGDIVKDFDYTITKEKAIGQTFTVIRRGKKNYYLIKH